MYDWSYYDSFFSWYDRQDTDDDWQIVAVITSPASDGDHGRPKGKPRPRWGYTSLNPRLSGVQSLFTPIARLSWKQV